jgi:ribosome maturation factor RimP
MGMTVSTIAQELHRELAAAAERSGCELLDVERLGKTLRLVVDRPEGVTLGDCETVSRQASAVLDVAEYGQMSYVLEVSSPGLDRKLYGPHDYQRFLGRQIRITWREPGPERKRTVVGRLDRFEPSGAGAVSVFAEETSEQLEIALPSVEVARLMPEV